MKIIEVPYEFSSYEFYSNVLPQIQACHDELVLDMSNTRRIDSLVIPNLLCCAYQIKREKNIVPQLFIPDTVTGGMIRNYLNEIDFTKYANKAGLYNFIQNEYGGLNGKRIDPICGTLIFDALDSRDSIFRGVDMWISPFTESYLSRFQVYESENSQYINEITEFLEEVLINAKEHAKSFSITTLHANYASKKVYISVSDIGVGFSNTLDGYNVENEMQAILIGVYRRKDSKIYGLYNVIRRVLEYGGKVRIHSNDTQLIFTPRILEAFSECRVTQAPSFARYNVNNTVQYDGVHIEIELPLEKGNRYVNNR